MTEPYDAVWLDARLATLRPDTGTPYGAIENGALAVRDGLIAYAGPMEGLDEEAAARARRMDAEGGWITPALVDCHTHLVHGGCDWAAPATRRSPAPAAASSRP